MTSALKYLVELAEDIRDSLDTPGPYQITHDERFIIVDSYIEITALLERHERMREWLLRYATHGVGCEHENWQLEYCRAGQFTRSIDPDGEAETFYCTCGLDEILESLKGEKA